MEKTRWTAFFFGYFVLCGILLVLDLSSSVKIHVVFLYLRRLSLFCPRSLLLYLGFVKNFADSK